MRRRRTRRRRRRRRSVDAYLGVGAEGRVCCRRFLFLCSQLYEMAAVSQSSCRCRKTWSRLRDVRARRNASEMIELPSSSLRVVVAQSLA